MAEKVGEAFIEYFVKTGKAIKGLIKLEKSTDKVDDKFNKLSKTIVASSRGVVKAINKIAEAAKKLRKAFKSGKLEQLKDAFNFTKASAKNFAKIMIGIVAGTVAATKAWADQTDQLGKTAQRLRITAQELQTLQKAGEKFGIEAEDMTDIIKEFDVKLQEAKNNAASPAAESFGRLGLSIDKMLKLSATERIVVFGDALRSLKTDAERASIQDEIFSDTGFRMGTIFSATSKQIHEAIDAVAELDAVISDEAIEAAASFNDQWADTSTVIGSVSGLLFKQMAPAIEKMMKRFQEWIKENKRLIAQRLEKFLKIVIRLFEDFVPLLVDVIEGIVRFADVIGGLGPLIIGLTGAFAALAVVMTGMFGPAAPFVIGAIALATAIGVIATQSDSAARAQRELESAIRDTTRARIQTQDTTGSGAEFRRRSTFTKGELATAEGKELVGTERPLRAANDKVEQLQGELDKVRDKEDELFFTGKTRASFGAAGTLDSPFDALDRRKKVLLERFKVARDEQRQAKSETDSAQRRLSDALIKKRRDSERAKSALERTPARRAKRSRLQALAKKHAETPGGLKGTQLKLLNRLGAELDVQISDPPPPKKRRKEKEEKEEEKKSKKLTLQEKVAELLGVGSGLSVASFRPAGLGTLVQRIDASIHFRFGDIDVTAPNTSSSNTPEQSAEAFGRSFFNNIQEHITKALSLQKAAIIG